MVRLSHVIGVVLLIGTAAGAQETHADRSLRLVVENDLMAVRGVGVPPDYDYTHGTRLGAAWSRAPAWARRIAGGKPSCREAKARLRGCVAAALELGQEIYTPRRDASSPVPGERPYAGWLYASAEARVVSPGRVRSTSLTLGVTGPPSLAAEVQAVMHRAMNARAQLGWAHQVRFEPGIVARYEERLSRERPLGGARAARLGLSWGGSAGNIRTALHAGIDGRVGLRGRLPWVPAEPDVHQPMRAYALAGYRQEVVLRNLFIEGNRPDARTGAQRRALVGQYDLGVGVRSRAFSLEYRHVSRGREYRAQPNAHAYGSVVFALHRF